MMLRTAQSIPGVISLFHSAKVPLSSNLFHLLEKSCKNVASPENKKTEHRFQLDVNSSMPTYDQYRTIATFKNNAGLEKSFPTVKNGVLNISKISYDQLKDSQFVRPVVVDWDNGKLAFSEEQLKKMLEEY